MPSEPRRAPDVSRSFLGPFMVGAGLMAGVDLIVFHQILNWHHFYDLSTPAVGLLADGLLHSAELIAIVAGFFVFADVRRRQALASTWAWAGLFMGAGLFQVFDGIFVHKVLRLHQIRYDVDILPYDIAWNGFGLALILVGIWLANRARSTTRDETADTA